MKQFVQGDDPCDVWYRGKDAFERQEYEQALENYVWFWEHALEHQPSLSGVRRSYLLTDFDDLRAAYAPAQEAMERLMQEARQDALAGTRRRSVLDLARLCEQLDCEEVLVETFEKMHELGVVQEKACAANFMELMAKHGKWHIVDELLGPVGELFVNRERVLEFFLKKKEQEGETEILIYTLDQVDKELSRQIPLVLETYVQLGDEESLMVSCRELGQVNHLAPYVEGCRDYLRGIGRHDLIQVIDA